MVIRMIDTKPKCGHSVLKSTCIDCERFKAKWYQKIQVSDPDWQDIEYGRENPDRLYQPVKVGISLEQIDVDPDILPVDPISPQFYDRVLEISRQWEVQGRSKRDCLIAELFGFQTGKTGTERGIAAALKSKRLRPHSRFAVRQTIKEIKALVLKIAQPHQVVEQASPALYPLDSKPNKDEANGKTTQDVPASQLGLRTAA